MTHKLIDNNLYVAYPIVLSNYESKLFKAFIENENKALSLAQICTLLRLDWVMAKKVLYRLANKISIGWQIQGLNSIKDKYCYYRLKEKD